MPGGRPSLYDQDIADAICSRVALGETLPRICADEAMPDRVTVWRWEQKHEEFRNALQRARGDRAHAWAEDVIDIADDGTNDWTEREGKDGQSFTVLDHEHVTRSRLRIETRLKVMAKHNPAYGDSVAVTGKDGGPIQTEDKTDDRAFARRIAMALAAGTFGEDR